MNETLRFTIDCADCFNLKTEEMDNSGFVINILDKIFYVQSSDAHRAYGRERLKVQKTTATSPEDAIKKIGIMFKKVKDQLKAYPKEKHVGELRTMFESTNIKNTLKEIYEGLD